MDDNSLVGRQERALLAHETAVEVKLKSAGPVLTPAALANSAQAGKGQSWGAPAWITKGKGQKDNPFRDQDQDAEVGDPNGAKQAFGKSKGGKKGKQIWW